ncbi:MAG: hypothetical protein K2K94_06470 [Muribaculaceae bacterium]|nr:hypothetical protein [Muribaculaceae bacterium]
MKLTKYLLVACSALLLASCGNDDDWNTDGNVTVQFASPTMKAKENSDLFYVPLEVTGKTNGPIRVTVDVAQTSENPAVANEHYIVTSKTVVIPNESAAVSIEFAAVNDMDINDDRQFTITITNVEGAKVGQNNSIVVTITDDDSLFYEAIQGTWTFKDHNYFDEDNPESVEEFKLKIIGEPETSEAYEKTLYLQGLGGASNLVAEMEYIFDEESQKIYLEVPYGQVLGQLNFTGLGVCDVVLYGLSGGYLVRDGSSILEASTDMRSITFDPADGWILYVMQNGQGMGGFDAYESMSMSR